MTGDRKRRRADYLGQPYVGPTLRAARKAKPGTVTQIHVCHDSWCSKLHGGLCDCSPEVVARDVGKGGLRPGFAHTKRAGS